MLGIRVKKTCCLLMHILCLRFVLIAKEKTTILPFIELNDTLNCIKSLLNRKGY